MTSTVLLLGETKAQHCLKLGENIWLCLRLVEMLKSSIQSATSLLKILQSATSLNNTLQTCATGVAHLCDRFGTDD